MNSASTISQKMTNIVVFIGGMIKVGLSALKFWPPRMTGLAWVMQGRCDEAAGEIDFLRVRSEYGDLSTIKSQAGGNF